MFGNSKPVVFKPYGRRRAKWRPPLWLVLLLAGMSVGAGGIIVAQERYLPPRLSAEASARVNQVLEQSERERLRVAGELEMSTQQLAAALAESKRLAAELASSQAGAEHLRDDLSAVVAALPPDPRGGVVEVRAGRFTAQGGMLDYEVVLTRRAANDKSAPGQAEKRPDKRSEIRPDKVPAKPLVGVMQLVLEGDGERGTPPRLSLKPAALSMGEMQVLRGSQPLPDDFKPRQATIQVFDRSAGKLLGTRVLRVSGPS